MRKEIETNQGRLQYDRKFRAIIKEAATKRGFVAEVTRQMGRLLKRHVHRQEIDKWLNPDAAKRGEPAWGSGDLLLIAVQRARINIDHRK